MNRRSFERVVARVIDRIPSEFARRIDNLVFRVEGWPDAGTLAEVGFEDPRELLGFYRGWPLTERGRESGGRLPDEIIVFQGPVEEEARRTGTPLVRVVRETILHELAHHFGFSEGEMDAIEELWAKEPP